MTLPWYDKHSPKNLKEIIGQSTAKVLECVNKNKPCLITGPSGTGKSATAYALAEEQGMQLIVLGADEERNKNYMIKVLKNALNTRGIFGPKLILIDDVERVDRGGMPELIKCIKSSKNPIIMTAHDKWDRKLSSLREHCELIDYQKVRASWIKKVLRRICDNEGVKASDESLYKIASNALGDVRAAINDLELIGRDGEITDYELESLTFREQPISIFNGLNKLYRSEEFFDAYNSLIDVDLDINEKLLWVSENAWLIRDAKSISYTHNNLSRADVFIGRVRRMQYYRYWVYANALMTAGIKPLQKGGYVKFEKPKKIMKLWRTKSERTARNNLLTALKEVIHASKHKIMKEYLLYIKLLCRDKSFKKELINELSLGHNESKLL